ncbi:MAG: helix-turn-helix domain-containing protein [Cyanophyceae cyanobacterium]
MTDLPIQTLMYRLRGQYPSLEMSLDAPDSPVGDWFLDLQSTPRITAQWHSSRGFGCSVGGGEYGEKPDEIYRSIDAVFGRIVSLLDDDSESQPNSVPHHGQMALAEIRKKIVGINQTDLSARMGVKQPTLGSMERGRDPHISSVRRYVEALGGELQVLAVFGDRVIPICFGEEESNA